ncbi:MAG TPA: DUF1173 family protein, partial [Rhodanobacter sp.]|nr:DUF1173 family protein [Rhodanobacter sp.]
KTAKAAKHHHRLVVIASLSRFDETRADQSVDRLPIAGPFGMPTLNLNAAAWGRVMRSFADELHAWRRHERVIAIAHVGLRSGQVKEADVLDVGLMRVSPRWIPLDSSYEGTIEEKLCQASRKFEKPLRFDADEAEVFPDFWLFDAGKDYPLEVFGMATNDYLARRDHKTAWYNAKYGVAGWWHWDAASDPGAQRIPPFPDPL